jgi:hypothetical protein
MRTKERDKWMELLASEREAHRRERQELLNRIAAPDRIVLDASPEIHEPQPMSATDMELAYVGGEVPDGISLGSQKDKP